MTFATDMYGKNRSFIFILKTKMQTIYQILYNTVCHEIQNKLHDKAANIQPHVNISHIVSVLVWLLADEVVMI